VHLGDEWNSPSEMGVDCAPSQFVDFIDRNVIAPFLGTVDTALEIGAGGGRFTDVLLPKARRVIASEVAPSMLPHLRARFGGHVECVLLDGHGLRPLGDRSVDAVLSYGVFVHLQHWDIFNYLVEIERVLVPGGKAVIHHANTFSTLGWQLFLAELPDQVSHHKYPGSLTVMTPDVFAEFCSRAALEVVACVTDVVKRDAISLVQKPA
jgi:ubiquinone/menaquinone biosynthesis C-methylase UbiE